MAKVRVIQNNKSNLRHTLITDLADGWRDAENYFLETLDDCKKWAMMDKTKDAKLTKVEQKELDAILQGWGV